MKRATKWITAAGVLALSTTLAFAGTKGDGEGQGWGGHRHGHHGMMGEKLAAKLNLSDAQKAQWKAIHQSFREENKVFFEQARQTHQDYRAAKEAGDTAKADSLKATMETQHAQMKQLRQAQEQKFTALLTPEQKAQFDTLKAQHEQRRMERQNKQ
jgi:Spy/CpxP family protein refolding chaperone